MSFYCDLNAYQVLTKSIIDILEIVEFIFNPISGCIQNESLSDKSKHLANTFIFSSGVPRHVLTRLKELREMYDLIRIISFEHHLSPLNALKTSCTSFESSFCHRIFEALVLPSS